MTRRKIVVSLTGLEACALMVAARYITEAGEPSDYWGMSGHELNALERARAKLDGALRPTPTLVVADHPGYTG